MPTIIYENGDHCGHNERCKEILGQYRKRKDETRTRQTLRTLFHSVPLLPTSRNEQHQRRQLTIHPAPHRDTVEPRRAKE